MQPDHFKEGINEFVRDDSLYLVFSFVCNYVRKLYSDKHLTKMLKMSPGTTIFQILTPSNIAYVVAVLKNGKEMWDNEEEGNKGSKKARPLFTSGKGTKRSYGITLWNKEGFEYYHYTEKNWRDVYNSKELFSKLNNGWERWEPRDGVSKQALKTWWKKTELRESTSTDVREDKQEWYNMDDGYTSDMGVNAEWEMDGDDDNDQRKK